MVSENPVNISRMWIVKLSLIFATLSIARSNTVLIFRIVLARPKLNFPNFPSPLRLLTDACVVSVLNFETVSDFEGLENSFQCRIAFRVAHTFAQASDK